MLAEHKGTKEQPELRGMLKDWGSFDVMVRSSRRSFQIHSPSHTWAAHFGPADHASPAGSACRTHTAAPPVEKLTLGDNLNSIKVDFSNLISKARSFDS